jgi:hypothetical protein
MPTSDEEQQRTAARNHAQLVEEAFKAFFAASEQVSLIELQQHKYRAAGDLTTLFEAELARAWEVHRTAMLRYEQLRGTPAREAELLWRERFARCGGSQMLEEDQRELEAIREARRVQTEALLEQQEKWREELRPHFRTGRGSLVRSR